ncbi:hypothetical protein RhiirC2_795818 [Rhizophagus irregularis]|uniref:Uncharacterized protein n=1 Tax=Rhizophagus irregularis TaxID=588596 RepID=A0A2N1MAW2_9GLOM|nr:hypothetical protein RhiirC2_795818 [Rhizophagus irregularis]
MIYKIDLHKITAPHFYFNTIDHLSTQGPSSKKRKRENSSIIWNYFLEKYDEEEQQLYLICQIYHPEEAEPTDGDIIKETIKYITMKHQLNFEESLIILDYQEMKLYKALINIKLLPNPHTAENIKNCLESILEEWNLKGKCFAATTDSGANVKKAISLMNNIIRLSCAAYCYK